MLGAGCSPSERLVLVTVNTSPEELGRSISSLDVKSAFENQTLAIKDKFPVNLGIYIPRETHGTLTVTVDGLDRNATLVATGMQDFPLKGGSVEQIQMTLVLVASGACPDLGSPPPDGGSGAGDGGVAVSPECDAYCAAMAASCPDSFGGVPAACPELCARSFQPAEAKCLYDTFTGLSAQSDPDVCVQASFVGGLCIAGCEGYCALDKAICGAAFTLDECVTSCGQALLNDADLACRQRQLALALGDPRHCDLARIAPACGPCASP